jgi:hypothetical protein
MPALAGRVRRERLAHSSPAGQDRRDRDAARGTSGRWRAAVRDGDEHRHFKWGKHTDPDLWREKTLNLVQRMMARKSSVKALMRLGAVGVMRARAGARY